MLQYKGFTREEPLRFDMLVGACLLVEANAAEKILPMTQGATLELHETARRACRPADQFSRDESD